MPFPTTLTTTTALPPAHNVEPVAVLDRLDRALYDYGADITNRGEGFFDFKVSVESRIARNIVPTFKDRRWWPLEFVRGGTITVIEGSNVLQIRAEVRPSSFVFVWLTLPFVIGAFMTPFVGGGGRLIGAILLGLVFGGVSYILAKWQFGGWLERTARDADRDPKRGRLTSA